MYLPVEVFSCPWAHLDYEPSRTYSPLFFFKSRSSFVSFLRGWQFGRRYHQRRLMISNALILNPLLWIIVISSFLLIQAFIRQFSEFQHIGFLEFWIFINYEILSVCSGVFVFSRFLAQSSSSAILSFQLRSSSSWYIFIILT